MVNAGESRIAGRPQFGGRSENGGWTQALHREVNGMDVSKIISELRFERAEVDRAIASLERLGGMRKLGRPPKWRSEIGAPKPIAAENAVDGKAPKTQ